MAISFALTTLDSATRLLRFKHLGNERNSPAPIPRQSLCCLSISRDRHRLFCFYKVSGQAAGLALWQLFGTTNQVLGALTLLTITLYLMQRGRPYWYTGVPMVFMLITSLTAMVIKIRDFWNSGTYLLLILGGGNLPALSLVGTGSRFAGDRAERED